MRALGYLWSAPYAVLGLLALTGLYVAGGVQSVARMSGAIHVLVTGPLAARMLARGWGAFTLGWTVFYWEPPDSVIVNHELRHVRQCLWLGPLFPVVYLVLLGLYGYKEHPLERRRKR